MDYILSNSSMITLAQSLPQTIPQITLYFRPVPDMLLKYSNEIIEIINNSKTLPDTVLPSLPIIESVI